MLGVSLNKTPLPSFQAKNGTLVRPEGIYLPDHAVFHGDESGRIIYAGSEEVR